MKNEPNKRVFFGLAVEAPWPAAMPKGRLLNADCLHMTLAFLGNVSWPALKALLPSLPLPSFHVGMAGKADQCLFLPAKHPHVVAWHVQWLGETSNKLLDYQKQLVTFLRGAGYEVDNRPFLPHITLARSPIDQPAWRRAFHPLPLMGSSLHLYESVGNLNYQPLWTHQLTPPLEEISHTADIAFRIYAESMQQLGIHAQIALCFKMPELLPFLDAVPVNVTLDDIVISLNNSVTKADSELGCPLKAISFHGDVVAASNGLLTWEMVVDV